MVRAEGAARLAPDMVLYANTHVRMGGNTCHDGTTLAKCDYSNSTKA